MEQLPRLSSPSLIFPTMLSKPSYRREVSPKRSVQRSNFTGGIVAQSSQVSVLLDGVGETGRFRGIHAQRIDAARPNQVNYRPDLSFIAQQP
jgi:hypothetical protein